MSTPTELATKAKASLLALLDDMNRAAAAGVKVEFQIETDAVTLQSKLTRFDVYGKMKLES